MPAADWDALRARFYIPPGTTYLDGNSLGLLSRDAEGAVLGVLHDWKTLGVSAWTAGDGGREWLDFTTRVAARADGWLDEADLIEAMTAEVALALFPGVVYTTGQLLDLPRLTAAARERGVTIGFDLSHSVRAVPHDLLAIGADFAFGCTHKYLSAGPGSTGFLFVHERHVERPAGLAGWFGSKRAAMFDMTPHFRPAGTAVRFTIGPPPLFSTAPLNATLDLYAEVGMVALRQRSRELTAELMDLADRHLTGQCVQIGTPRSPERRGGHVSLRHPGARQLCESLVARGIIPDFRNPDLIRLDPSPLYNTSADLQRAIRTLAGLL